MAQREKTKEELEEFIDFIFENSDEMRDTSEDEFWKRFESWKKWVNDPNRDSYTDV
jgi:hypothetical protein